LPWDTYLKDLVLSSGGILLLVLLLSPMQLKKTWLVLVCTAMVLLVHSIIPHKEYRYIFTAIPLSLIALALLVFPHMASPRRFSFGAIAFLIFSGLGLFHQLPNQGLLYNRPLLYSDSHLEAYLVLYEAKDLSGVYDMTSNDGATGGYYYLHRNVPVYFDDQLKAQGISKSQLNTYVSHVIALDWQEAVSGFETIARVGHHEIRRRIDLR
jgi:phosphatidylinositol glycan class B